MWIMSRDLRPSKRYAKRTYLENADISKMINDAVDSCEEKITTLETIVRTGLDYVLPLKTKTVFTIERTWITKKHLVKESMWSSNVSEITSTTNASFVAPSTMRTKYNTSRSVTRHTGWKKSRDWVGSIIPLGQETTCSGLGGRLQPNTLVNHINTAFLTQKQSFKLLTDNSFGEECIQSPNSFVRDEIPTISKMSVFQNLSTINATKAQRSDGILGWQILSPIS